MEVINAILSNPVNLLSWIIFGFIAGYIVNMLDPTDNRGLASTVILGIVGAIIGGYLSAVFLGTAIIGFSLEGLVAAVIGGIILAALARLFFRGQGAGPTPTRFSAPGQ